jgi:hypothetical protein
MGLADQVLKPLLGKTRRLSTVEAVPPAGRSAADWAVAVSPFPPFGLSVILRSIMTFAWRGIVPGIRCGRTRPTGPPDWPALLARLIVPRHASIYRPNPAWLHYVFLKLTHAIVKLL